ncbi:MAG: ABC transporter ATP-binding protein/permease [Clostridiales Family XIII bacterium]|jgi:ATP-binding cassette subfamily B protein|nr:ABC transporter ATP-binding protein/permease [Clostridiales Family XIII bacterium]
MSIIKHIFSSGKNTFIVILILALLVIQAYCDLTLPAYTSDIVDVGIMQGGIEDAAPTEIRESSLDDLEMFMTDAEIETVRKYYEPADDARAEQAAGGAVLRRATDDEATIETLNKAFAAPMMLMTVASAESDIFSGNAGDGDPDADSAGEQPDPAMLMAGYRAGAVTKEQMLDIRAEAVKQAEAMGDAAINQAAVIFVKAEYEAIGMDLSKIQTDYMTKTGAMMILYTFVSIVAAILVCLMAAYTAAGVSRDLRQRIYNKTLDFSGAEMEKFTVASLITRNTNDIQQIQLAMVLLLRMVLYAPVLGVGGVIKVVGTDTGMGWIVVVAVALLLVIVAGLMRFTMPKFKMLQALLDKLNLVSREILTGLPVIRAFGREAYEERRFDKANRELIQTQLFTGRAMSLMMPIMMFIMNLITISIVWFGGKGIDAGDLQVGDMMAFITYTMQIVMSFMILSVISIMLPRANVAAERVDEVLNTPFTITDKPETSAVRDREWVGDVFFNRVHFRFPDAEEDVLSDISFTANAGETTAIIGSTGSGKSTLINLIPRLFDVTAGSISIDGVDIRDMSRHRLRDLIGVVPQKGILFNGTIASNLKFGNAGVSDAGMREAAEIAQAAEFIDVKDEGYESPISQGGGNVSGGQKQRLSIARALAKQPKILIFDDSFSALDYKTDAALRKTLNERVKDATVIIVAQRISTILRADKIIVLDEGRVSGIGTHRELLKTCEVYREIATGQLSEAELGA